MIGVAREHLVVGTRCPRNPGETVGPGRPLAALGAAVVNVMPPARCDRPGLDAPRDVRVEVEVGVLVNSPRVGSGRAGFARV